MAECPLASGVPCSVCIASQFTLEQLRFSPESQRLLIGQSGHSRPFPFLIYGEGTERSTEVGPQRRPNVFVGSDSKPTSGIKKQTYLHFAARQKTILTTLRTVDFAERPLQLEQLKKRADWSLVGRHLYWQLASDVCRLLAVGGPKTCPATNRCAASLFGSAITAHLPLIFRRFVLCTNPPKSIATSSSNSRLNVIRYSKSVAVLLGESKLPCLFGWAYLLLKRQTEPVLLGPRGEPLVRFRSTLKTVGPLP